MSETSKDGGTQPEEELLHVALCREADDLRALHKLIGAKLGEEPWTYWDATGVPLTSAVENLLGLCGFSGKRPPKPEVRALSEQDVNAVPLIGFTVPASTYGAVRAAIVAVASGQIGGFSPMLVAQAGFHDAAIDVLAHVWSQVGRPQIWICRPPLGGRGSADHAPLPLPTFAGRDLSYKTSQYLRDALRQAGGS